MHELLIFVNDEARGFISNVMSSQLRNLPLPTAFSASRSSFSLNVASLEGKAYLRSCVSGVGMRG